MCREYGGTSETCFSLVTHGRVCLCLLHAWQHPGFSTVWANLMSCMPEAEYLLKARTAELRASGKQEPTVVCETEMVSGLAWCADGVVAKCVFLSSLLG